MIYYYRLIITLLYTICVLISVRILRKKRGALVHIHVYFLKSTRKILHIDLVVNCLVRLSHYIIESLSIHLYTYILIYLYTYILIYLYTYILIYLYTYSILQKSDYECNIMVIIKPYCI
jgi:hypothetical protein